MSWFADKTPSYIQRLLMSILQCGPIPTHIAFIMDGNRRFAQKMNLDSNSEGHSYGFSRLSECLQWCWQLGIREVTLYAFSIENFKRHPSEVQTLLSLAEEKFEQLLRELDRLKAEDVCVRICGDWSLLTPKLRQLIARIMIATQSHKTAYINVAFAYTAREEICTTLNSVSVAVQKASLKSSDVSDALVGQCLYISSEPNLLVRTSGELRLSDFMLWQCSSPKTYICFVRTLWPEFSIWNLLWCIFKYQRFIMLRASATFMGNTANAMVLNSRVYQFPNDLCQQRLHTIE